MAKDRDTEPASPGITISFTELEKLIESRTKDAVAQILGGKTVDEQMQERMDLARGKHRPLPPEEKIHCRSPLSGASFTVRVVTSKSFPDGRVVEILDYVRPEGWDKHKDDGGLYDGLREEMVPPERIADSERMTKAQHRYRMWLYKSFWQKDWNAISGKPASFLAQWRIETPKAAE